MKRIGIYGGTFNPPHLGHMIVADHVAHELQLDRVLFVPSYISPHKRSGEEHAAEHRLAMVRLAVEGHPCFEVCDIEVQRKGASFTIDTLRELRGLYPPDQFFLLIGADNLREFVTWKSHDQIPELASVVAMTRPGYEVAEGVPKPAGMISMEVPSIQISSSEIRKRVREGRNVSFFLQVSVLHYIKSNGLYLDSQL
jgi:nicotinate-nucleotide adenylyltransferase